MENKTKLEEIQKKITGIRSQIVDGEARGENTSKLVDSLIKARAEEKAAVDRETADKELAELRQVAAERVEWQRKASDIEEQAKRQAVAIGHFLEARDTVVNDLKTTLDKLPSLVELQSKCYGEFQTKAQFQKVAQGVPVDFFPALKCSFLGKTDGGSMGLHLSNLILIEDFQS
jgi:hypothetical protein